MPFLTTRLAALLCAPVAAMVCAAVLAPAAGAAESDIAFGEPQRLAFGTLAGLSHAADGTLTIASVQASAARNRAVLSLLRRAPGQRAFGAPQVLIDEARHDTRPFGEVVPKFRSVYAAAPGGGREVVAWLSGVDGPRLLVRTGGPAASGRARRSRCRRAGRPRPATRRSIPRRAGSRSMRRSRRTARSRSRSATTTAAPPRRSRACGCARPAAPGSWTISGRCTNSVGARGRARQPHRRDLVGRLGRRRGERAAPGLDALARSGRGHLRCAPVAVDPRPRRRQRHPGARRCCCRPPARRSRCGTARQAVG